MANLPRRNHEEKHKELLEEAKKLGVKEPQKLNNDQLVDEIKTAKEVMAKRATATDDNNEDKKDNNEDKKEDGGEK